MPDDISTAATAVGDVAMDDELTSLELLADYECPECGPMDEVAADLMLTEEQALFMFGGDADGIMRCPNDWCGQELEQTLGAALDMANLIAERFPALAPQIAERMQEAIDGTG